MLEKIKQKIFDKICEAENDFETSDLTEKELEYYENGLKMAITLIEEFESEPVAINCYGKLELMNRKKAIDNFLDCFYMSEGSEQSRYGNILADLMQGAEEACDE